MAAQWPLIVNRLVALLPTLSGWSAMTVFDGKPITEDWPANYCTVGYVFDDLNAGTYSTTQDPDGYQYQETGEVRCQATVQTGDIDLSGMRTLLFSLTDALEAAIRTDRTLGVLSKDSTLDLLVQPLAVQNNKGTAFSTVFTVRYLTVT